MQRVFQDPAFLAFQREAARYAILTEDEEKRLIDDYRRTANPLYRNHLINCNLRFVLKVAMGISKKSTGVPLMDLVQAGVLGFCTAIDKFEPARGWRLCTYAVWWLRATMQQERYRLQTLGLTGSLEAGRRGVRPLSISSLDATRETEGGDGDAFVDSLETRETTEAPAPSPEELAIRHQVTEYFYGFMQAHARPLEQDIILHRFLLDEDLTLEEIGARHGVSRERVRQLEAKLWEKLQPILLDEDDKEKRSA